MSFRAAAVIFVLGLMTLPATAGAQVSPLGLTADVTERGYVGLTVTGAAGAGVQAFEVVGNERRPVGRLTAPGRIARAAAWRCDRRDRRFLAVADGLLPATAQAVIATPTCRRRLQLIPKPRSPRAGRPFSALVIDRFGVGDVRARVCLRRSRGRARCKALAMRAGIARGAVRFRPGLAGRWSIQLRSAGVKSVTRRFRVRRRRAGLRVLATGDSMIQIVDSFLDRRLERGRLRVRSDARISTGISKPQLLNWPNLARRQAGGIRPDATVMFIGANDGFPIGGAQCCGPVWARGYASRVRSMMRSYSRGGAGAVYWLTLPVPRRGDFRPIYRSVNVAIRRAARAFPDTVRVVELERLFSPGGRYTSTIRYGGRRRTVRQADGVHLNTTGASIAATAIIRAMRRDGVL